jgi:hypothetical protein
MTHIGLANGHKTKIILYFDEPDILLLQQPFVGEKPHDIDLIDLIFFTGGNKQRGPFRFSGSVVTAGISKGSGRS